MMAATTSMVFMRVDVLRFDVLRFRGSEVLMF
jgi:hypothetical protein